jgi:hypothetical protein
LIINPPRLFGKPPQVIHRDGDFALALADRLSILLRNDSGYAVSPVLQLVGNRPEQVATAFACHMPPAGEGRVCVCNGPRDPVAFGHTDLRKRARRCRINHRPCLLRIDPFTVQIERMRFHRPQHQDIKQGR